MEKRRLRLREMPGREPEEGNDVGREQEQMIVTNFKKYKKFQKYQER